MVAQALAAIGPVIGSVVKGLNIGTGLSVIQSIMQQFRPLVSVVSNLMKMLLLVLSPLQYLLTGLLIPILLILKPIAILVKKLMMPFFSLAMQAMVGGAELITESGEVADGAALFTVGAMTLLNGVGAILTVLSMQVVQMVGDLFLNLFLLIFGIFIPISETQRDAVLSEYQTQTDNLFSTILGAMTDSVAQLNQMAGLDTTQFKTDANDLISELFSGDTGFGSTMSTDVNNYYNATSLACEEVVASGTNSFLSTVKTLAEELGKAGKDKVETLMAEAQSRADEIANARWYDPIVDYVQEIIPGGN